MRRLARLRHGHPGFVSDGMRSLPVCRWRAEPRPDQWHCLSPKFLSPPNAVQAEFCAACTCADHLPAATPPALPCVHRGGAAAPGGLVFACAMHVRCTLAESYEGTRSCAGCPDYLARDLFGSDSATMHRRADDAMHELPAYPAHRYRGRGVVIAGGGDKYFASLYVTIRALRHAGCTLPIQVWYLGRHDEMPPGRQAILAPWGVECVDADEVRLRHPARNLDGWELKVFATLHSPFEELLFLDADCYPCRNPEYLFDLPDYRELGAIFWPDVTTVDLRLKWPAFLVPDPQRLGSVESGQYVVNKRTTWRPLNLAWFYNDHSDYYYRYGYGDKHTFEVAWARCSQPFVMWQPHARWTDAAYLHPGPEGETLFVHRCADKFRLSRQTYVTWQRSALPLFREDLPLEHESWGWMAELARALGVPFTPPTMPE
jgi:hypothetical protein